jgi:hypothetical protein
MAAMSDLEEHLLTLFRKLPAADQASLLAFAEFLHSRAGAAPLARPPATSAPQPVPDPEPIPRPEQESVVKAVKRLSRTYPMLDKSKMLTDTSALVMQHVVQGRDAIEVIDELEIVFQRHYARLKSEGTH